MDWLNNFVMWGPLGLGPGLISIVIFSVVITGILTFVYKKLTNQQRMKEIKAKQKELQQKAKEEKDKDKLMEINKEMMQLSGEMLKMSFKPMLITFLPLIVVFTLLRSLYSSANVGDMISWGVSLPVIGTGAGWFLSYVLFSFVFSLIFNKIFKNF